VKSLLSTPHPSVHSMRAWTGEHELLAAPRRCFSPTTRGFPFITIPQHHYETYRHDIVPPNRFRRSVTEVTGDNPDALALYDLSFMMSMTTCAIWRRVSATSHHAPLRPPVEGAAPGEALGPTPGRQPESCSPALLCYTI